MQAERRPSSNTVGDTFFPLFFSSNYFIFGGDVHFDHYYYFWFVVEM
jgi:hypothetical protein